MRRRLDGHAMLDRDEQVTRMREQGVPFREIAARLGCSLGSVQKSVRRVQARHQRGAPADEFGEEPLGPIRFVGVDEVDSRLEVFVDERGRRFNLLDLYRHAQVDGGVLFGAACRQLEAAGRRPPY